MAALTVLVLVLLWLHRRGTRGLLAVAVAAAVGLASVGTLVQVARIGHSGAKAVWSSSAQASASSGGDDDR
jgi:hypothetical protein